MSKLLWVSSCGPDMWAASGKTLVSTFLKTKTDGLLAVGLEGAAVLPPPRDSRVEFWDLGADPWLAAWLARNADLIPTHLGGRHPGVCRCPGGPLDVHDKRHRMPCIGHWFNRNAARWFRKIAALKAALARYPDRDTVVWVDSDVVFRRPTTADHVAGWFHRTKACFYLKNKRPVLEAGVVGYKLPQAKPLLDALFARYESGRFRTDPRWDDCYQLQKALDEAKVPAADLAYAVGPNAKVVESSAVGPFLAHGKGQHRAAGVMT